MESYRGKIKGLPDGVTAVLDVRMVKSRTHPFDKLIGVLTTLAFLGIVVDGLDNIIMRETAAGLIERMSVADPQIEEQPVVQVLRASGRLDPSSFWWHVFLYCAGIWIGIYLYDGIGHVQVIGDPPRPCATVSIVADPSRFRDFENGERLVELQRAWEPMTQVDWTDDEQQWPPEALDSEL